MTTTLQREIIPYTTHEAWLSERAKDITSTDVAALFGVSPYCTRWELWHRKVAGDVEPDDIGDVERVRWGKRLEDAIANGAAEERKWAIEPVTDYVRLAGLRIGSSFDYRIRHFAMHVDRESSAWEFADGPNYLLECKNVDSLAFKQGWEETDFGLEAPAHIELQVQHQMLVSGIRKTYIAALVGGNRLVILERDYDEAIGERILSKVAAFWEAGEPVPDFHRDAELIRSLYANATPGVEITADARMARLMQEADDFRRQRDVAGDEYDARVAELATLIGDAERVHSDGYTLRAGTVGETTIERHVRKAYRRFQVTKRKA